jgi:hypothetical protein
LEERDAPWQTMLGATNHYYCVLINVGLWLEVSLGFPGGALDPYVFGFSQNMEIPAGGMKSKGWAQDQCREYFKDAPFDNEKGPLGTHSLCKYGSTYCCNNGVSREDTNTRGCWKTKSWAATVSDRYDDTELPFVDACVAAVLCVGGPCSYVAEPCITNDFILQHATPLVVQRYNTTVVLMFGHAMIWVAFSQYSAIMPANLRNRIVGAYNLLPNQLPAGTNPIKQLSLVASGRDNEVYLTEIDGNNQTPQQGQQPGGGMEQGEEIMEEVVWHWRLEAGVRIQGCWKQLLLVWQRYNNSWVRSKKSTLRIALFPLTSIRESQQGSAAYTDSPTKVLLHAAAIQQQLAQRAAAAPVAQGNINPNNASLSPTPCSLFDLWAEWSVGVGSLQKTSQQLSVDEKNSTIIVARSCGNWLYHWSSQGWQQQLPSTGIYDVYGAGTSVTNIINQLKKNVRNGTLHPTLRV